MLTADQQNDIAREVVDASVAIHRQFGPGCFETAYARCLEYALARRGFRVETGVLMDLRYETMVVPRAYQVDMLVEDGVVIEIKAVEEKARVHGRQLLTYLKLTGLGLGLLLNFGAARMVDGIERIVNNFPDGTLPLGQRSRG